MRFYFRPAKTWAKLTRETGTTRKKKKSCRRRLSLQQKCSVVRERQRDGGRKEIPGIDPQDNFVTLVLHKLWWPFRRLNKNRKSGGENLDVATLPWLSKIKATELCKHK